MKKLFFAGFLFFMAGILYSVPPDEGLWIPLLIEKYNIKLMKEKGFKLEAEDIYSVNKASMKDGIVIFGGGCTGELISSDGLLITNHHCGFGQIQSHSSLEHDYLTDGFWAMSHDEELPNPGLTVTFLKYMEDVTEQVLKGTGNMLDPAERNRLLGSNIAAIVAEAVGDTHYSATVRPFFMGNQYFLFVYEVFSDVRLVGAPPSAIGKFGGETDNWVWPRHTGDFSLFRIYAGEDNKPAPYSKDNIPYKPVFHFPVSLKGANEGDFTMVFGYPGSTNQYVPSYHIEMVKDHINPRIIDLRSKKIEIIDEAMNSDPLTRIKYAGKKSGIANSWKKWIGEIQGLEKMGTVEKKKEFEKSLTEWINADDSRRAAYGNILREYSSLYGRLKDFTLAYNYTNDAFFSNGVEAVGFARNLRRLGNMYENKAPEDEINSLKLLLLELTGEYFRDYDRATDKKLFAAMMQMYGENLGSEWLAPEYLKLQKWCRGDFYGVTDKLYDKSVFDDEDKLTVLIETFDRSSVKKLKKDPFYRLSVGIDDYLTTNVRPGQMSISNSINDLNRDYMKAQMEFDNDRVFYPDANSTLRIAYGNVGGYHSRDAVYHKHYTTIEGIMEKDNPEIYDYDVPDKLRELYDTRDYGRYTTASGEMPVCFIANNHTTGGNSGSPVINAEGHLIGINFDRAWEGVASDMAFNPDQSRNISLDIRYALFIIDKFAGAGYLLDEMTIVE
ncbi:MAG: S46 family peptidase [Bacteroidales bacterium]|jgi:hypothetical protein|nr:S46 family peptidase [Bacteroidales bacterium]